MIWLERIECYNSIPLYVSTLEKLKRVEDESEKGEKVQIISKGSKKFVVSLI